MSQGQIALESRNERVGGENEHTSTHTLLLNLLGQHRFSPQRLKFGHQEQNHPACSSSSLYLNDDPCLLSPQSEQWEETSDTHAHDEDNDGHVGLVCVCVCLSLHDPREPSSQTAGR